MPKKASQVGPHRLEPDFDALGAPEYVQTLGVTISRPLLIEALTHRSYARENGLDFDQERLEFLGDSILGMVCASYLYRNHPAANEATLSKMRASVVNGVALAIVARSIGLGDYILLSRGELTTDGRSKNSILADTMEALIGAVYEDHGFEEAQRYVLSVLGKSFETARAQFRKMDWKSQLVTHLARTKLPQVTYSATRSGPEHEPTYDVVAKIPGVMTTRAEGSSKKAAEHRAARAALLEFWRLRPESVDPAIVEVLEEFLESRNDPQRNREPNPGLAFDPDDFRAGVTAGASDPL